MYKVLIIDDDEKRSKKIKEALGELQICSKDIKQGYSIIEGKKYLEETNFDAVIIDIVLPNRKGDKTKVEDGGVKLLRYIKRKKERKLPSRVIGITSNLTRHLDYQLEFGKLCEIVIRVELGSRVWLDTVIEDIQYRISEKLTSNTLETESALVTIHGIQTFGEWQERLYELVSQQSKSVSKLNYDYGYLDLFSFLVPFLRNRPVDRLYEQLVDWSEVHSAKKFYFVAHSFGTYILANALNRLISEKKPVYIEGVILCGSVLKSKESWEKIRGGRNFFIVNECGTHDFILWLSNMFAPRLGMSGKTGFNWINTEYQLNRYHLGGHSLYFEKKGKPINDFMEQNWLPLIVSGNKPKNIDERQNNLLHHGIFEFAVKVLGKVMIPGLLILVFILWV